MSVPADSLPAGSLGGDRLRPSPVSDSASSPTPISARMLTMKKYVGHARRCGPTRGCRAGCRASGAPTKTSASSTRLTWQVRKRRRHRRHARRDADRDREHVVDEQRRGCDQARRCGRGSPSPRCTRRRRSGTRGSSAGTRTRRWPAWPRSRAPIGVASAERRAPADEQHAQDLFGRVGHRRQRVGRQHRQPGDAGEPLVMREMGRNGRADEETA